MIRGHCLSLFVFAALAFAAQAEDAVLSGKVKKVDPDKGTVTLTVGREDRELTMTAATQTPNLPGQDVKTRLQGLKEGTDVKFKVAQRDGKQVLVGLLVPGGAGGGPGGGNLPPPDTSKLVALTDLGTEKYQGYEGGLYPGGKNERPADHEKLGLEFAKQIQPLDESGKPSANGKIVLLTVGMSNTAQSSEGFRKQLDADTDKNPNLTLVTGAQGGVVAAMMVDPEQGRGVQYWKFVDDRLKERGVTRAQVQAIWIKQADANPSSGFPKYAETLESELEQIVRIFPARFPNAKLVYLSSRTYGGYAKTRLNPDPYAYESGFSVKWLIEKQIKGDATLNCDPKKGPVKAPWLSWGPYLWANGAKARADGFSYEVTDFGGDGTHQSPSGQAKVGKLLLDFFKKDSTTKTWFLKS